MAAQQPTLQFRLFEHPGLSAYRDSYPRAAEDAPDGTPAAPALLNGSTYTYNPNRTPDAYLSASASASPYTQVAEISELVESWTATWRSNDICTWSATIPMRPNSGIAAEINNAAKDTNVFATMHVTDVGDSATIVDDLMRANFFGGNVFTNAATPTLAAGISSQPSLLDRFISGPVLRVRVRRNKMGLWLTIQGTCWGKFLQQTTHLGVEEFSETERTGAAGFQRLIRSSLSENAEYTIDELDIADLGTDESRGGQAWRTAVDQDGLAQAGLSRIRTPLAAGGIISFFTPEAVARITAERNTTVFSVGDGQHGVLRSQQRLAERGGGVIFGYSMPAGRWSAPSTDTVLWTPEMYIEADYAEDRPEGNAWVGRHFDYRRNWIIYTPATDLVENWGEIQVPTLSSAIRPANFAEEPRQVFQAGSTTEIDRAATERESDIFILESIKAQHAALALKEAQRFSATVDIPWDVGTRVGIDFSMGTRINVDLDDNISSSAPMETRQYAGAYSKTGAWNWSAALGPKAEIVPRVRVDELTITSPNFVSAQYDAGQETIPGAGEPVRSRGTVVGTAGHSAGQPSPPPTRSRGSVIGTAGHSAGQRRNR